MVDPGRPIDFPDRPVEDVIARGFGLQVETVTQALRTGDVQALQSISVPLGEMPVAAGTFGHLHQGLDQVLVQLSEDALAAADRPRGPGPVIETAAADDARAKGGEKLQKLLRDAKQRARQERES
jgi:hypothetical protein